MHSVCTKNHSNSNDSAATLLFKRKCTCAEFHSEKFREYTNGLRVLIQFSLIPLARSPGPGRFQSLSRLSQSDARGESQIAIHETPHRAYRAFTERGRRCSVDCTRSRQCRMHRFSRILYLDLNLSSAKLTRRTVIASGG